MKSVKNVNILFGLIVVLMLGLVACSDSTTSSGKNDGKGNLETDNPQPDEEGLYSHEDFEPTTEMGDPIDEGNLTVALVSDSPFSGTLNANFAEHESDGKILDWIDEEMLEIDDDFVYDNDEGIATYEIHKDDKSITFTIEEDVKWSDGEPFTIDDWAFSYEVIGHPDYEGAHYDASVENVKGMKDYHDGKTDEISGIDIVDDHTMEITFNEFTPSLNSGGLWVSAMPKHIFEDMDIGEMAESDEVRKNPVGLGPYKVDSLVEGESVILTPNEHYWRGEPALDEVTLKIVDSSSIVQALKKGEVDIAKFPYDMYENNADLSNIQFLGAEEPAYQYLGFKLGTWDKDKQEVDYKPEEMKMGDIKLREAMWYAVDNDTIGDQYYKGLRWGADTLIDPAHGSFHNDDAKAPTYDPDKANEILDEAGYEIKEGEDFRTTPDGEELVINFAAMEGGDLAEPIAKYYMQAWEEIGLQVELLDGRLQEGNSFYERVGLEGDDDPDVDVFLGGWALGPDVDPSGLYGPQSVSNFSRYRSNENDEFIEKGLSEEAFDVDYRKEVYDEWQELMIEDIPVIPTLYNIKLEAVNNRVINYDVSFVPETHVYEIGVTEEEAEKADE